MIKKYYHATTASRLASITFEGIKPMIDLCICVKLQLTA